MFARIKKIFWKGNSAAQVTDEAVDIIRRYQRLNSQQKHQMTAAFEYTKARLEIMHGEIDTWSAAQKATVAQEVLKMAKEAYGYAPYGSCGVALVGLCLEAQTLNSDKAKRLLHLIEAWHRRSTIADLGTDRRG